MNRFFVNVPYLSEKLAFLMIARGARDLRAFLEGCSAEHREAGSYLPISSVLLMAAGGTLAFAAEERIELGVLMRKNALGQKRYAEEQQLLRSLAAEMTHAARRNWNSDKPIPTLAQGLLDLFREEIDLVRVEELKFLLALGVAEQIEFALKAYDRLTTVSGASQPALPTIVFMLGNLRSACVLWEAIVALANPVEEDPTTAVEADREEDDSRAEELTARVRGMALETLEQYQTAAIEAAGHFEAGSSALLTEMFVFGIGLSMTGLLQEVQQVCS